MSDTSPERYVPIDCSVHDVLESLATLRRSCEIVRRSVDGTTSTTHAVIVDVYAQDGAEYLRLESGETIRLDRLESVDGTRVDRC